MPMNIPVPDYNTPLGFQNYTLFTFFFVERSIGLKISATHFYDILRIFVKFRMFH